MKQADAHPLALGAPRGWKKGSSVLGYIFSMALVFVRQFNLRTQAPHRGARPARGAGTIGTNPFDTPTVGAPRPHHFARGRGVWACARAHESLASGAGQKIPTRSSPLSDEDTKC